MIRETHNCENQQLAALEISFEMINNQSGQMLVTLRDAIISLAI